MPNELLEQIYDENHREWDWETEKPEWSDPKTLIAPLSKRLLDVQRRQLYKSIDLNGPRSLYSLARLLETIRNRPALGSFVQVFTICAHEKARDSSERIIRDDLAAGGFKTFFRLLPKLKSVKIWGCTAGELGGLVEALGSDVLSPTCAYLSLFLPDDCFNRAHFFSSHLKRLRLSASSSSPDDQQSLIPLPLYHPIPTFPLTHLTRLVMHDPEPRLPFWVTFLARCTCLTTLEIFGGNDLPIYTSLLEAIPVPTSVTSLSIWTSDFPDEDDPHTLCAIHVSRLSGLKKLTLGGEGDFSQTILDARQNRQLENLTIDFRNGASISSSELFDFISSLPSNHSLRRLNIDVRAGRRGRRAAEVDLVKIMEHPFSRIAVDLAEKRALGWRVTELPDCLYGGEFSRIKQISYGKGVEIGGSIVKEIELQKEYRREATEFRRMWNEWKAANPK